MTDHYNSKHMFYLIRIQRAFRPIIARIRRRREDRVFAPYGTPEESFDDIDEAGTQDLKEFRK